MTKPFIINFVAVAIMAAVFFWCLSLAPVRAAECRGTTGLASWYGTESGNRTATGERFTGRDLTAAMPSRRHFGEHYRVTYRGKSVVVRINDLGPHKRLGRAIDLSSAAADKIGLKHAGVGRVCMEKIK